jgi:hypothetical protein
MFDSYTFFMSILSGPLLVYQKKKNCSCLAEFIWHLFICFLLFYPQISCDAKDKMLHILALLKFELVQKKVLIFVNSIDAAFRLRLFLEKVD